MTEKTSAATPSAVVAHDDFGMPITESDLVAESYRAPLPGAPIFLVPPDDFEGDDDDWETHSLIESVKARRRVQRKKESGHV